jgi:BirA family biotin operon repressor/biotin-[acetyl-CoA-carboxylase] ligase
MPAELHPARIRGLIDAVCPGAAVILYDRCGSTNTIAAEAAVRGAAEGTVVIAERQEAGRGRAGRTWVSMPGASLTFSLILRPERGAEGLTALAGLTAAEAIEEYCGSVSVKWPNDIYIADRKLGGILAESKEDYLIIGLGININESKDDLAREIAEEAISMRMHTGQRFDRGEILSKILTRFAEGYIIWRNSGFPPFRKALEDRLLYIGSPVRAVDGGEEISGILLGVTDEAYLRLSADDGERIITAGDVSLRPGEE